jgi:hypothetical protein
LPAVCSGHDALLENCQQADIDAWFAIHPPRVGASSKVFLGWARRHWRAPADTAPDVGYGIMISARRSP